MGLVGLWEEDDALSRALGSLLPGQTVISHHPAAFAGREWELLLVAPSARGWAGARGLYCRNLFLPGSAAPLARLLRAERAVSYGASPRDTLTISSLDAPRISIALQRSVPTLSGGEVEEQEFPLLLPGDMDPLLFLALPGSRLLLGAPPDWSK